MIAPTRAGTVSLEIDAFERPNRLTFLEGRRRLSARMTAQPRGAMWLMSGLMAKTMRTQFEAKLGPPEPTTRGGRRGRK